MRTEDRVVRGGLGGIARVQSGHDVCDRRTGELDAQIGYVDCYQSVVGILQERAIRRGEVLTEQLQVALNSRVVIEQAKGVIAQRMSLTMDGAFELLRNHSRHNNLRLAEVARQVVARELDPTTFTRSRSASHR